MAWLTSALALVNLELCPQGLSGLPCLLPGLLWQSLPRGRVAKGHKWSLATHCSNKCGVPRSHLKRKSHRELLGGETGSSGALSMLQKVM